MHFKKRLIAVAAVVAMDAAVFYGSTLEMRNAGEEGRRLSWFDRLDTIYFWYSDESMSNFVNSAAVSFGEREGVHVIPVLTSDSEYLEALNKASVEEEQLPDVYIIGHDSLEKAYLAGLAVGYWKSTEEVLQNQQIDRIFTPDMDAKERNVKRKGWNKAVKYAYGWAKEEL